MFTISSLLILFILTFKFLSSYIKTIRTGDPNEFKEFEHIAKTKGFLLVSSSPLTRSSYHADEDFRKLQDARNKQLECLPHQ